MSCSDNDKDFLPIPGGPLECVMKTTDETPGIGYGAIIAGGLFLLLGGLAKCFGDEAATPDSSAAKSGVTGGDQGTKPGPVPADSKSTATTDQGLRQVAEISLSSTEDTGSVAGISGVTAGEHGGGITPRADCKDCKSGCLCFLNCFRPCWYIWILLGLGLTVFGILCLAKVEALSWTHDDPVNTPCYRRGQQKDSDPALIDTVEDVRTTKTGTNTKSCRCKGKCTSAGFASCRTNQTEVECPKFA